MQVFGPCFDAYAERSIMCSFDGVIVPGLYVSKNSVICVSPALTRLGRVDFALHISGTTMQFAKTTFYSCKNIHMFIYVRIYVHIRMYVYNYVCKYILCVSVPYTRKFSQYVIFMVFADDR